MKVLPDSKNKEFFILAIILAIAAFMRLFYFADWSLSNDELSALNRLRFDSFSEIIREGVMLNDFHPAGVQIFLYYWTKIFGLSVISVRLPFIIAGIFAVYFIYKIAALWFGKSAGIFTALTIALLEFPILYSQLARPYSPGLLFSMMSVWFWTKILFAEKVKNKDFVFYVISTSLATYMHHFSFLFVLIVGIIGLFFLKKNKIKSYLIAAIIIGILYLPHLKIFLHQMSIGGVGGTEGWLAKPESGWLGNFIYFGFNHSIILIVLIIVIGLLGVIFNKKIKFNKFHVIAICFFFIPFIIGYYYSIYRNPVLQHSILLFSFPFLPMFIFSFYKDLLKNRDLLIIVFFGGFILVNTVFIQKFYQKQHFGEFKKIAETLVGWEKYYGSSNITFAISVNGPYYIQYYLDDFKNNIEFAQYNSTNNDDLLELKNILDTSSTQYFAYAWTKPVSKKNYDLIQSRYPYIIMRNNYSDLSEAILFTKNKNDFVGIRDFVFSKFEGFEKNKFVKTGNGKVDSINVFKGKHSVNIDSVFYGPGIKINLNSYKKADISHIETSLWAFCDQDFSQAHLVMQIDGDTTNKLWYSSKFEYFLFKNKWGRVVLNEKLPKNLAEDAIISVYIWNPKKEKIFIDDFSVNLYKP